jgi:Ion transport protein
VKNKPPVVGRNDTEWAPRRLVQDLLIPCKNSSGETCHRTHHHVHSQAETGVAIAVMLNMAVISCYHYGMSKELTTVLDHLNTGFLVLFAVEMALKLFALGFKRYWTDASNAFDGSIVVGSLAIMLLSLDPTFASLSYFTQIARLFRVGRLLRLTHHFPRLKKLFETIIYALPSMGNVTALLLLVLFVGTIIGMEMFGDVCYFRCSRFMVFHSRYRMESH